MMRNQDYSRTIVVEVTPAEAYDALTIGIEHWWTKPDVPIRTLGDRAKFTFPPGKSYWTFEASKLVPQKRVELHCVDALHIHEGKPKDIETEWLGTTAVFAIEEKDPGVMITLEHKGLNSDLICYDICEAGWDFFFLDSLKSYLETGTGKPHQV